MAEKFFKYFDERYRDDILRDSSEGFGPVITISRLTGCDALAVAKSLVKYLNKEENTSKWKWVDKEILFNTAQELDTGAYNVESYVRRHQLSGLSEMLMAISGRHISDAKVKKTIKNVVMAICKEGHVVLVGRGGVALTGSVKRALHVRLVAPFYWRVDNIIKKKGLNIESAEEFIVDTDEKRHNLIVNFLEKKPINLDYLFDATINRSSFSIDQIARTISILYTERMDIVNRAPSSRKRGH